VVEQYRKKPVVVSAVKWDGQNDSEILDFCGKEAIVSFGVLTIRTLEGVMGATVGDYIIRGVNGEFYPCKPDIFEKTYEKEEDEWN
jgi:hypothetical protein